MKQFMKRMIVLGICAVLAIGMISCGEKKEPVDAAETKETTADTAGTTETSSVTEPDEGLWKDATYKTDTELGTGAKTVTVKVEIKEKSIDIVVHTDAATLGEALLAVNLVEGEEGQYGLYIKKVNGVTADYDIDQSYWCLMQDGEALMTGADSTNISDNDHYELVYTK